MDIESSYWSRILRTHAIVIVSYHSAALLFHISSNPTSFAPPTFQSWPRPRGLKTCKSLSHITCIFMQLGILVKKSKRNFLVISLLPPKRKPASTYAYVGISGRARSLCICTRLSFTKSPPFSSRLELVVHTLRKKERVDVMFKVESRILCMIGRSSCM